MSSLDRMDPIDRTLLIDAQERVAAHLGWLINGDGQSVVHALTDPEIRHLVQTILDLEPTRRA